MRKNFGAKPYTYPQPVFIISTYDENGIVDAMNAAWGGIIDTNQIAIALSADHKTVKNILKQKAYTISMATSEYVKECDYVGVVSANNNPNKMAKTRFTYIQSDFVNAPIIEQLPMCLECKMVSYDTESEIMIGEIINVSADESVLTEGKIDPFKLHPITFDPCNNGYIELGMRVGNAFKDGLELK
ncbi:MAG: flavin reductase [Holdemanella sp.]|nr:flavin reductase [Holdemanella sp.]